MTCFSTDRLIEKGIEDANRILTDYRVPSAAVARELTSFF